MNKQYFTILFVGDVFGKVGRIALKTELPKLIKKHNINFVIVNAENASHGKSLTKEHYYDLKKLNIDCFTMGNHTFYGGKLVQYLNDVDDILVPANYNAYNKFTGSKIFSKNGKKLRVTSILGQTFMFPIGDNPWKCLDNILENDDSEIHIVDFHGEATSEKIAFGYSYDGLITAQVGTHTHVQTADEKILPKGTGFISDLGMTGPYNSIIGSKLEPIIDRLKKGISHKFIPAKGKYQFMGCLIYINNSTNKVEKMERINIIQQQ